MVDLGLDKGRAVSEALLCRPSFRVFLGRDLDSSVHCLRRDILWGDMCRASYMLGIVSNGPHLGAQKWQEGDGVVAIAKRLRRGPKRTDEEAWL